MGLLSKMTEKATQEWAKNLTLEQIEELEKQGCDVSEYRIIYEEQQAEKQRLIDSNDLSMLDKYKKVRSAGDAFVEDVAKFNKLSDKKKQKLEQAPLVYGKVVQAHYALFKSNPKNKDGAGIVFLYALDDAHRYDEEWLTKTANRISEMKASVENQGNTGGLLGTISKLFGLEDNFIISSILKKKKFQFLPEDCRSFMKVLCNDKSRFCLKVSDSLSDGAEAWCATYSLWDQSKLPMAQIPHNRIIPLLLTDQPQGYGGIDDAAQLIPPTYYTK